MNLFPDAGKVDIDLSNITFEKGYSIPPSGTIASDYQKGFELSPEMATVWKNQNHEIASELIMSYYRSQGFGNSVKIHRVKDHDDCIGGVLVTVVDAQTGVDAMTYGVSMSGGKVFVEEDRREFKPWGRNYSSDYFPTD